MNILNILVFICSFVLISSLPYDGSSWPKGDNVQVQRAGGSLGVDGEEESSFEKDGKQVLIVNNSMSLISFLDEMVRRKEDRLSQIISFRNEDLLSNENVSEKENILKERDISGPHYTDVPDESQNPIGKLPLADSNHASIPDKPDIERNDAIIKLNFDHFKLPNVADEPDMERKDPITRIPLADSNHASFSYDLQKPIIKNVDEFDFKQQKKFHKFMENTPSIFQLLNLPLRSGQTSDAIPPLLYFIFDNSSSAQTPQITNNEDLAMYDHFLIQNIGLLMPNSEMANSSDLSSDPLKNVAVIDAVTPLKTMYPEAGEFVDDGTEIRTTTLVFNLDDFDHVKNDADEVTEQDASTILNQPTGVHSEIQSLGSYSPAELEFESIYASITNNLGEEPLASHSIWTDTSGSTFSDTVEEVSTTSPISSDAMTEGSTTSPISSDSMTEGSTSPSTSSDSMTEGSTSPSTSSDGLEEVSIFDPNTSSTAPTISFDLSNISSPPSEAGEETSRIRSEFEEWKEMVIRTRQTQEHYQLLYDGAIDSVLEMARESFETLLPKYKSHNRRTSSFRTTKIKSVRQEEDGIFIFTNRQEADLGLLNIGDVVRDGPTRFRPNPYRKSIDMSVPISIGPVEAFNMEDDSTVIDTFDLQAEFELSFSNTRPSDRGRGLRRLAVKFDPPRGAGLSPVVMRELSNRGNRKILDELYNDVLNEIFKDSSVVNLFYF